MKPMDHIAWSVGWVAITSARLEAVIGFIIVKVLGEDRSDEFLGRSWSYVYEDAKEAYRALHAAATERGDDKAAQVCANFTDLLHKANQAMQERHHVLHATWTANLDVITRDGASTALRRRGVRDQREWSLDELLNLVHNINDLHQRSLNELERLVAAD
jgi:inorganic triphosphatase YgiF